MKKMFLTFAFAMTALAMTAVPAKRGLWSTIQLSDGTEVRVESVGDEHGHWLRAADGTCYALNNGVYERVEAETLQAKRAARVAARRSRKSIYASTSDGLGQYNKMSMGAVPSIGSYTIPVVMVQFSDLKFKSTTTVEKMKRYYNEEGYREETGCVGSVRDYFKAQSNGMFIPTFDVVGIVTLSKSYKYYGANDSRGDDENLFELPGDVIAAAVSQLGVDFSKYVVPAGDSNHSAGVPLLSMFYAGRGEATEPETTENGYYLWPCEWDADEDEIGKGNYNGVHFNSFFIGNELYEGGTDLMGMGVFCHEFGHALGLPDFYVTDYSYSRDDAFGNWSIMDTGAYVEDTYAPIGYNAYEKSYMGWLNLQEINDADEISLQVPENGSVNSAYIIRNSNTETFIFENRQPGTWYPAEYGSGVLVMRIAYKSADWTSNTLNNTQSKKRACVLTADGKKLYYSASSSNLYGNGKSSITSLKTYSGSTLNPNITGITKNSDGTITLTLDASSSSGGTGGGTTNPDGALFYESFDDCDGKGGNDGSWSGNVASGQLSAENTDVNGWTYDNGGYKGDKCAKFGTGSKDGKATTPSITVNGTATLSFKAGAWDSSKDGTTLNLSVSGGSISQSSVTMKKGAFTDFTATIIATGIVKVTFAAQKGRFFLDEVIVTDPNTTGIREVSVRSTAKTGRIYTLDGRYVGTDLNLLQRGIYIIDGKKVCK